MKLSIIYMRSVPGKPTHRALTKKLSCQNQDGSEGFIPFNFQWDGSSVNIFIRGIFPRHRHPIASCCHDWRCKNAKTKADRAFADKEFKKDVEKTSWWITAIVGYIGVRIGTFFGYGSIF